MQPIVFFSITIVEIKVFHFPMRYVLRQVRNFSRTKVYFITFSNYLDILQFEMNSLFFSIHYMPIHLWAKYLPVFSCYWMELLEYLEIFWRFLPFHMLPKENCEFFLILDNQWILTISSWKQIYDIFPDSIFTKIGQELNMFSIWHWLISCYVLHIQ